MSDPDSMVAWRRHLHAHPELGFDEHETASFVAGILRAAGLDVTTGIGGTGVVGTLRAGGGNRAIGLRAEMDALAITEQGTAPYRSTVPGQMHACGHDGHTAALLGAATALAAAPGFDGTVHFIFQPAEEHGRGMQAMLDDGLLRRFPLDEVYGLHNMPGLPLDHFATAIGAVMAAEDNFVITVTGRGGHAARPQACIDPILAASAIVLGLQQIVARRLDPVERAVVSVTEFTTDGTRNVIPTTARLLGDCRSFSPATSQAIEAAIGEIASATAAAHGATASLAYSREFVPTINSALPTEAALRAAGGVMEQVHAGAPPVLASEDFARLLERVPGNFAFVGNGTGCAGLHNPTYDFDDRALPGMRDYFVALVADRLPKDGG